MKPDTWWIIAPNGERLPGTYKTRMVKGGQEVPVRLTLISERDEAGELVGDEILILEIDGERVESPWDYPMLTGVPIAEAEYRYLLARRKYEREHGTALADARKPIDFLTTPVTI
jgi:hypothetical protein